MNTLRFVAKRILLSVVILFFVALIIYTIMRCLPTSYIENVARAKATQPNSKSYEEWMAQLSATYGMDKGIIAGFFIWLGQAIRGNFGDSWQYTVPVIQKFKECIGISFWMSAISMIFEWLIAIPLGIIAAKKQYSRTDYAISIVAIACMSLPTFFLIALLKLVFCINLGWFDLVGVAGRNYAQLDAWGKFLDRAHHMVRTISAPRGRKASRSGKLSTSMRSGIP